MRARFPSIVAATLVALFWMGGPAAAQEQPAAPVDQASQLVALREDLVAAQQEIVRLRAQVADRNDLEGALKAARDRNDRLVAIAGELIAAYEKRYRRGQYLPFDTGRRKFEAELQNKGDAIYDNRWNAGPRRPASSAVDDAPQQPPAETEGRNED